MHDRRLLFIFGTAAMATALMLMRLAATPDFLNGLVFGVGAGLLFLFVGGFKARARRQ